MREGAGTARQPRGSGRTGRILVATWNGGGNLPPALALASRLVNRGHRVALLADREVAQRAESVGAEFLAYTSVDPWPAGLVFEADPARFDEVRNGTGVAKDLLAAAKSFAPNALVVDCMMGAALAAAELLAVPTAVLVHVLYQPFVLFWADLSVRVGPCREALGLEPVPEPVVRHQLERLSKVLVLVPEEFDYPGAPRSAATHYVGPILAEKDAEAARDPEGATRSLEEADPRRGLAAGGSRAREDEACRNGRDGDRTSPLVLASLSTTYQHQEEVLPALLEALGSLEARAVLTLGGVIPPEALPAPDNVEVLGYVPHAEILPKAGAVLCHGGLSTVMASLAYAVPLVCVPQGREQSLNAERVQACGAGIALSSGATAQQIARALEEVLAEPRFCEAAEGLAERIAATGRGQLAVDHVEELLG